MNQQPKDIRSDFNPLNPVKFSDPLKTADGQDRAFVRLKALETLWINTGTLCNITCTNCYINSSPTNDDLVYFKLADAVALFDEIRELDLSTTEIGFTGGEPFMNPQILEMAEQALKRGFRVLILTNAMQPMQRKKTASGLLKLNEQYGDRLVLRVSLDHYTKSLHEAERGPHSWDKVLDGLNWLTRHNFRLAIAGRTCWGETDDSERAGYASLIARHGWAVDSQNHGELILFPEMDERVDVPEITTACWGILNKVPEDVMCATSRMVVRRKGADAPVILPCTLIAEEKEFEMGQTLKQAGQTDGGNFKNGAVRLNHPHCAKFCVLGGGSCSG